jgi:putative endonuclease
MILQWGRCGHFFRLRHSLPQSRSRNLARPSRDKYPGSLPAEVARYARPMPNREPKIFFVYMTASKARGIIYVGMISDLVARAWQHCERVIDGFTKRYWTGRLVYYEFHETAVGAVKREYLKKRWRRDWKIELIEKANPTWRDVYPDALASFGLEQ